jgi:hypothetical protein
MWLLLGAAAFFGLQPWRQDLKEGEATWRSEGELSECSLALEGEVCFARPVDPSSTLGGGDPVIFMLKRARSKRLALSSQKAFM